MVILKDKINDYEIVPVFHCVEYSYLVKAKGCFSLSSFLDPNSSMFLLERGERKPEKKSGA